MMKFLNLKKDEFDFNILLLNLLILIYLKS